MWQFRHSPNVQSRGLLAAEPDDLDLKLALCVGSGMTIEAACEMLGVSSGTYYNRTAKNPHFFSQWRSFGELLWTKVYSAEAAKIKTSTKAEDKLVSRLDRALAVT